MSDYPMKKALIFMIQPPGVRRGRNRALVRRRDARSGKICFEGGRGERAGRRKMKK
jgi:hypothetical protein